VSGRLGLPGTPQKQFPGHATERLLFSGLFELIASSASRSSKVALCLMRRLSAMALSSRRWVERGKKFKTSLGFQSVRYPTFQIRPMWIST
jgi:hypothetical protein